MSLTGETPTQLTTIGYYPMIPNPVTDYETVHKYLKYAEKLPVRSISNVSSPHLISVSV